METRGAKALLVIFIVATIVAGCAGRGPVKVPGAREVSEIRTAQPPPRDPDKANEDGETFEKLATKMDEYQNLMAICESLAHTEENRELRDSCATRLRLLRQELQDLTNLLQIKPE
jgi:hypothetical protein